MILVCLETRQQCAAHSLILAWLSCIACCYEQQFGPYHLSNGSDRLHWHFEPYCPLEKKRMIINWCHKCHISFALLYAYSNILLSLVAFILAHVVFSPLLWPLHPRVARIPDRQRKQSTKRPSDNNSESFFQRSKSCYCVESWGYLYPQPSQYIYILAHIFSPYISTFRAPN